ncbi:MAG TPA: cation transporter [Pyrinomonadaceae bacterium]|nr:cation transporter [Pyrinomonadaceae bacterium]
MSVSCDSIKSLIWHGELRESISGIILAIALLIIMPLFVRSKRNVARSIKSGALMADSKQTELCTYLSAILLTGLLLNALVGWWWADPVAALIMVPIIVKEGVEGVRGETCCEDECGPREP